MSVLYVSTDVIDTKVKEAYSFCYIVVNCLLEFVFLMDKRATLIHRADYQIPSTLVWLVEETTVHSSKAMFSKPPSSIGMSYL